MADRHMHMDRVNHTREANAFHKKHSPNIDKYALKIHLQIKKINIEVDHFPFLRELVLIKERRNHSAGSYALHWSIVADKMCLLLVRVKGTQSVALM